MWATSSLVLLGFGLRIARLDYQSLWNDELGSVVVSSSSLRGITLRTAALDAHPPLSLYLLHLWMLAGGSSEFAARSLSVVFGVLCIPALYLLLRAVAGRTRALVGVAALAGSAFHVYYSQEARMYAEACFFVIVAAWALQRATKGREQPWTWAVYAAAAIAALYTFYYTGLVLLALNLPLLLRWRGWRRAWWLSNGVAVAALIPWLLLVARTTTRFTGEPLPGGAAVDVADFPRVITEYAFGITASWPASVLPAALLLAMLLACAWRLPRQSLRSQQLLLWAFLPPPLVYLTTLLAVGAVDAAPRLVLTCLPAWIGVVVGGWPTRWRPRNWAAALAVLVFGVPTATALVSNYANVQTRDDYRAIFAVLRQQGMPDEALVYDTPEQAHAVQYYYQQPNLPSFGLPALPSEQQTDQQLAELGGRYQGVWALLYGEPKPWVENWLDAHLQLLSNQWYGPYVRLAHFAVDPLPAGQTLPGGSRARADFGPLRLAQLRVAPSAGPLEFPVELLWQVLSPVNADYTRSLQLADRAGNVVAQSDGPPLQGALATSRWMPGALYDEPVVLQPGQPLVNGVYTLRVTTYLSPATAYPRIDVLHIMVASDERTIALNATSDDWTVRSVTVGTGRAGDTLVRIDGSVQRTPAAGYTWFVHVLDDRGQLLAQDDHPPLAPTTTWQPGDGIGEVFDLPAATGGSTLEIGAYDASGWRVLFSRATAATADHLTVPVE